MSETDWYQRLVRCEEFLERFEIELEKMNRKLDECVRAVNAGLF